jgi:3-hydroxyacyl-[acyl-carrier-protein] dehydratase
MAQQQFLFDLSEIDLTQVIFDQESIREVNPQRGDMEMLNGIVFADPDNHRLIGYKDVREDEFWVNGHIPGRPLFPGVLMIEAAAQLASFYAKKYIGWTGFVGFGGVDECRFRMQVTPPCRLFVAGELIWKRSNIMRCRQQGILNGSLVFDTIILGARM